MRSQFAKLLLLCTLVFLVSCGQDTATATIATVTTAIATTTSTNGIAIQSDELVERLIIKEFLYNNCSTNAPLAISLTYKEVLSESLAKELVLGGKGSAGVEIPEVAKVAIEAAYWHLVSQISKMPLRRIWGGKKTQIPAGISIGLGVDLKDSINRVIKYIDTFHPERAKIKIKPGIDVRLIKTIRSRYPKLPLMVDANASFTPKNERIFFELDKFDLVMIEQPYAYNDLVNHSILQKKINTPICLDESISSLSVAEQAIALASCRIINIKPQRIGGYYRAKQLSELAARNNIGAWCGGMIESGWGQLFNSHIASLPNFTYENDICLTKWYLADDILEEEIPERNGYIDLKKTDKLFKINLAKFKKYQTLKIAITK